MTHLHHVTGPLATPMTRRHSVRIVAGTVLYRMTHRRAPDSNPVSLRVTWKVCRGRWPAPPYYYECDEDCPDDVRSQHEAWGL